MALFWKKKKLIVTQKMIASSASKLTVVYHSAFVLPPVGVSAAEALAFCSPAEAVRVHCRQDPQVSWGDEAINTGDLFLNGLAEVAVEFREIQSSYAVEILGKLK